MFLRVVIFIAILGLLNIFVSSGIIGMWPGARHHLVGAWFLAALFFALQLTGMIGERTFFHKIRSRGLIVTINWVSYLAFGILSCLCLYLLVSDLIAVGWMLYDPYFVPHHVYRIKAFFVIATVLAFTTLVGVYQAVRGPQIVRVQVPLKGLPKAFDGFTIAQISDLHTGPTINRAYTENVVRLTQGLNPDMIALTGDFADGHVDALANAVAPLADLKPRYGKYFITGNHEYYWGADAWQAHFRTLGADVLANEHRVIEKDGAQLVIAGVTDHSSGISDPARAALGAPSGVVKILLAHQPISYKKSGPAGYALQLSGHTHNGQYFPFTLLIGLFQKFAKGLNHYGDMFVYVNRGTGYWGPPLRTFNSTEITLLTLSCA